MASGEEGYSLAGLALLVAGWAVFAALLAWLFSWSAWPAVLLGLPACVLFFGLWRAAEEILRGG